MKVFHLAHFRNQGPRMTFKGKKQIEDKREGRKLGRRFRDTLLESKVQLNPELEE